MQNESLLRTLSIASIVIFVCALVISSTVVFLRPLQAANKAPNSYQHILAVADLVETQNAAASNEQMLGLFQQVETQLLDLNSAKATTQYDRLELDYRKAENDKHASTMIDKEFDAAKIVRRPNKMPIYWIHSNKTEAKLVLPIYGKGMWSTIHGYIALEEDLNTISGVNFYEQSDTPGIGEKIQNAQWLNKWKGKKLYDNNNVLSLKISSNVKSTGKRHHQIDGISGATQTVDGIFNIIHYWFGSQGYKPFLDYQKGP
jgi:Na+-transporting NADH:ubiquinone oxidoreductase subunit C